MFSSSLQDRTVFVTGASAGIGAAVAEGAAALGARLVLAARRADALDAVAERLRDAHGVPVHTVVLDVRDARAVEKSVAELPGAFAAIDVLVNNAGLGRSMQPVQENTVADIDDMVDTNVKGLLYVTRAVVPGMVARGRGHVVNIGSTAGHGVYAGGVVYCATKSAVLALTEGLKLDLHGTAVRVTAISPGMVETDFSLVRFHGDAARADAVYADTIPLTARDVADSVLYAITRPAHVNISEIVLMSTAQSGPSTIARGADVPDLSASR